jgi:hypothetical protein
MTGFHPPEHGKPLKPARRHRPPAVPALEDKSNERLRALWALPGNLEHSIAAATAALSELNNCGRPLSYEVRLIHDLSIIWARGTGKKAGVSSAANFDNPRSRFGRFVRHTIDILP